jgi:hypothetical protein
MQMGSHFIVNIAAGGAAGAARGVPLCNAPRRKRTRRA